MGSGEINTGGNPAMEQYPIQRGVKILLGRFMLPKPEMSNGPMGHLTRIQTI